VQVLSLFSVALRLTRLVLWSISPITPYSIAGSCLTFASSISVAFLLLVEHKRLIRPSSFITLYLLCRIAADSIQLRTIVLRGYSDAKTGVLSAVIGIQAVFLVLESWPNKRDIDDSTPYSPEDTAGILNRSILWWLAPLFWLGNKRVLMQSDLFNLDVSFQSSVLSKQVVPVWEERAYSRNYQLVAHSLTIADKNKKRALLTTLFSILFVPWLRTIPPGAANIAFKYSQTFLLNDAVTYLATPSARKSKTNAYGMIGAAVLIYFGMAVSILPIFPFH
jgi:ATP-binding cassette subfamily C (CFTR/MRP) protein 1